MIETKMIAKITKSPYGIISLSIVFILISVVPFFFFLGDDSNWRENLWNAFPITLLAVFGMLFLPLFTIRYVFKENPKRFGWGIPENMKKAASLTALGILIFLPIIFFFSSRESFQNYYLVGEFSLGQFLLVGVLASLVYYTAEEFLFRGFLFWGLWHKVKYHSFWITSLIFTFFHLTKPPLEVIFAFFLSLVLSYLSLKTKSFIPAVAVHFAIALVLNVLIIFFSGAGISPGGTIRF
ncbi:MAG: CPBP family intramembrane metalloprotease [Patescibacteria group bacterium]|nr:CPBP family intramembrane metalloprotease [Patescibacteria group bacterium]